jgi:predicted dehydrogenase
LKKRIALIGLGKQNTKDHLVAIQNSPTAVLVGLCDSNQALAADWAKKLGVPAFNSVEKLLDMVGLDAAVVAVPHFAYLPIIKALADHGVSILKEKPLAMNFEEAKEIAETVEHSGINLTVAVQRKHNKIYQSYLEYASQIGTIFSIHGHYTLNIGRLDEGWRSSARMAGGGAVLDMGYHLIDLITWYFGLPDRVSADLGYHNRINQSYDVEDTAKMQFSYKVGEHRVLGSLLLSRIYPEKAEALSIYGTKGTVIIYKDRIELFDLHKELLESTYLKSNGKDVALQLDAFLDSLDDPESKGNYKEHMKDMVFIDAVYRSDKNGLTIKPLSDKKYQAVIHEKQPNRLGVTA